MFSLCIMSLSNECNDNFLTLTKVVILVEELSLVGFHKENSRKFRFVPWTYQHKYFQV